LRRHHRRRRDPERVTICHCTDCQTGTGSAFRVSVPVAGKAFKMAGQPSIYVKTTAENGNPRINAFCPTCGSPIYSSAPGDDPPESYMLRVGILRQRDQLTPRRQIWFRSAQAWITDIGGVPKEEKQTGTSHLR
jgi:hypothetical protein